MTSNYIYLLQEREFIRMKEPVYKIGRTSQENHKRFSQYPKGSVLLFQMICQDCQDMERKILNQFKEQFNHCKDLGNEYFEGDCKNMIDAIYTSIKNEVYENDYSEKLNSVALVSETETDEIINKHDTELKLHEKNTHLQKYTPYFIDWDDNGNYWLVNRNYEIIGLDTTDRKFTSRAYVFDDSCPPWCGKQNFLNMQEKYIIIIESNSLGNCMNPNKFTDEILSYSYPVEL